MPGPIGGYVAGHYFGFFNGVSKEHYERIVAAAPFDACNLLILAFVHTAQSGDNQVAVFTNWRDNQQPAGPGDLDEDRVALVVETARKKNPQIKILISLGWGGANDVYCATRTPGPFAQSVAAIVQKHGLDGFDIDYESIDQRVQPGDVLTLAQRIRSALGTVTPARQMIMTITPAYTTALIQAVLEAFDYVMPQTYWHGGNGTTADPYAQMLGSTQTLVYGVNAEGYVDDPDPWNRPDCPQQSAASARYYGAGVFAWRLDNDSLIGQGDAAFPTFAVAKEMWELMQALQFRPR
jgi:hypothetical protein